MTDAIAFMESVMTKEEIEQSDEMVKQEILKIQLARLREETQKTQSEVQGFSQPSVSKIERRKDIKISTLMEYVKSLGFGLEIRAYAKDGTMPDKVL